MMTDDVRDLTPDWRHKWLHQRDPFDAFDVWLSARWNPLTASERLSWLQTLGHYGANHEDVGDESGGSLYWASLAYADDSEVPRNMVMPSINYAHFIPLDERPF